MPLFLECQKFPNEGNAVEDVEWDLDTEEALIIDFFFFPPLVWEAQEDPLARIHFRPKGQNDTFLNRMLIAPPLPRGVVAVPPSSWGTLLFPLPQFRIGWNRLNLTLAEGHSNASLRLEINKIDTGIEVRPGEPLIFNVSGLEAFVNCVGFYG